MSTTGKSGLVIREVINQGPFKLVVGVEQNVTAPITLLMGVEFDNVYSEQDYDLDSLEQLKTVRDALNQAIQKLETKIDQP